MKNSKYTLLIGLLSMCLDSCAVVGGIFKAGMGVGIFLVVVVIIIIVIIAAKVGKK